MKSLEVVGGIKYVVWRDRLHNVMAVDYSRNPLLWFAERITDPRDMVCVGTKTRRECMEIVGGDSQEIVSGLEVG